MTALKCILWRRPRKHSTWPTPPIMSLAYNSLQRKSKIRSRHWLKQWCKNRKYHRSGFLSRACVEKREMPCLEPTLGSDADDVTKSPEMPTLVPFTTEHEDPLFKMLGEAQPYSFAVAVEPKEEKYPPVVMLNRLGASSVDSGRDDPLLSSPLSLDGFPSHNEWMPWPAEYEGCSCEDFFTDVDPKDTFPEIDIIDGVEFLSFLQEDDMNFYSRMHSRSTVFLESPSPGAGLEDFIEDKTRGLIFPTKTKDITQIKGWKRKIFAEDPEMDFLGSSPENVSWMVQEESAVTEDSVLQKTCSTPKRAGAFVSSSLDDFLKTSSELRIDYLTSYIPHVAPIPSDSPILSVGTLSKDDISDCLVATKARERTPCTSSIDYGPTSVEKIKTERVDHDELRTSPSTNPNSEMFSPDTSNGCLKQDCNELMLVPKLKIHRSKTSPCQQIDPPVDTKYSVLDDDGDDQKLVLIRGPVFDSDADGQKIDDFLLTLRSPPTHDLSRLEMRDLNFCSPVTVTEELAQSAILALLLRNEAGEHGEMPLPRPKRGRKRKVDSTPSPCNTSEKRNKRMIRLPARFHDSALLVPGSEGWVSPDLFRHSDLKKKQSIPKTQQEEVPTQKTAKMKTDSDDLLKGLAPQRQSARTKNHTIPSSPDRDQVVARSKASADYLKLKYLGNEGSGKTSQVRSLLIVHSSLNLHEATKNCTVDLPLAAIALPCNLFDEKEEGKSKNLLVYLLYGPAEAMQQHRVATTHKAQSFENLLHSASPVVPLLHSISANVSLEVFPFTVRAVLEGKVITLLVYPVATATCGDERENRLPPKSHSPESPSLRRALCPNSEDSTPLPKSVLCESFKTRSRMKVLVNSVKDPPTIGDSLPNGNCRRFNGKIGEISSMRVSKEETIVMNPGDAVVRRPRSVFAVDDDSDSMEELPSRLRLSENCFRTRLGRPLKNHREQLRRRTCREHLRYLYNILFCSTKNNENMSKQELLDKATEHILSLCGEAKKLKEEKERLRSSHDHLVTTYMKCLESLPPDMQKKALDRLSQQIGSSENSKRSSSWLQVKAVTEKDEEVQKVAEAAWNLVGPCSVQRVTLRNGHTVYVYSSHDKEGDNNYGSEDGHQQPPLPISPKKKQEMKRTVANNKVDRVCKAKTTSLWVSDVGEPCYVTRLDDADDEKR